MIEQKTDDRVGALWTKTSARGVFMTGTIELGPALLAEMQTNGGKLPVVVFNNDKKTGNQPDWRILKSRPQAPKPPSAPSLNDEDVPF